MKKQISLFIVGLPRSGTKLLRELLNNHTNIFIPSIEAFFIPHIIKKYSDKKLNLAEAEEVIREIQGSLFFFYYLKDNDFDFEKFIEEGVSCKDIINSVWVELAAQQGKADAQMLGDKTPRNVAHLPLLMKEFPNTKIIHIVRDPRDNVISARNKWNKNIFRAAYKWQRGINQIMNIKVDKNRFIELKYEGLILNTEKELRRLCDFLEIDYQDGMNELRLEVEFKGEKIDRTNYNKYLKEMSKSEIRYVEQLVMRGMQHYNYNLQNKDIEFIQTPGKVRLLWWMCQDWANMIKFRIKENGLLKGIQFIYASKKHA